MRIKTKELALKYQKKYIATHPWVKHKQWAQGRAKYKGLSFNLSAPEVKVLWERDKAYELRRPSIDRINASRGYSFKNCRFIELHDNIRRGNIGRGHNAKQTAASRLNMLRWNLRNYPERLESFCTPKKDISAVAEKINKHFGNAIERLGDEMSKKEYNAEPSGRDGSKPCPKHGIIGCYC